MASIMETRRGSAGRSYDNSISPNSRTILSSNSVRSKYGSSGQSLWLLDFEVADGSDGEDIGRTNSFSISLLELGVCARACVLIFHTFSLIACNLFTIEKERRRRVSQKQEERKKKRKEKRIIVADSAERFASRVASFARTISKRNEMNGIPLI
ncbi:hypothetical protein V1477_002561 [Vespula maculifrons]|uniref:Uncharacterized protein n=1 Tax=Vespula maculifrons TaxID=7453 RepID=A0ABD2CWU9_VESMC